ncbi:MAG: hypothetical protein IPJ89_00015 [Candidatus Iainarchaeum archaeon]|uniref:Uncharacterized protein n=1 Tax=Candidatus Iainarchaeum sp. TaxID=3101447 RepID=A0A7T9I2C7_9ARCH|nr:MAG: hypothetical protein IPJ89_00015 [Candidatus Diapherotrites archaeon]
MCPQKGRPDPRILLEHQAGSLMRKKRRIHGDFEITSTVIPNNHIREFIAEMLDKAPAEAEVPTIAGEKTKNRRLQLTATGRWHHSIFRPFPKPWSALSARERERLYHYFTRAAQAHARELEREGNRRHWIGLLGGMKALAKIHVDNVASGLGAFELNHGEPGEIILREAKKYSDGWKNLHSILQAIFTRANREER